MVGKSYTTQQSNHSHWPDPVSAMHGARQDICAIAAEVGIDGHALLETLPAQACFLTGQRVPVLHKRYQGSCSVRLYINKNRFGQLWPFIRFHTFKDGGLQADFNGLRWIRANLPLFSERLVYTNPPSAAVYKTARSKQHTPQQNTYFPSIRHLYRQAKPVQADHPWLEKRLCGLASSLLLARLHLREKPGELLFPIECLSGETIGYHRISWAEQGEPKRHYVKCPGAMKGAFVRIKPVSGLRYYPILLCEGVATALSLALVWPGEIRAVLTANNYQACRQHLQEAVVFAHDQDTYKPKVGNVGLNAALRAAQPADLFITPQFFTQHLVEKPTDFNDMLRLYGAELLLQAMGNPWQFNGQLHFD